ncbi:flagellar type III secretion system pore protein FliP [Kineococcus radiotolerans]|uniref:Flagellar biosynthetic protein FliP n=1 Tax=Kineococcus radiotolerans (strain ATCC BAA-149 / DSM 14245 / SRS30216) TaxID=266940 RepID=A6W8L3_KINRD|nr:flagellar type III secretion system pore protein FliP [Kineococcus radiotolerans]ABS03152.1 flagellar biosynthetic protein FliP [Kineococcus radiotolerans SRS30216 = ATCC BAA-149]
MKNSRARTLVAALVLSGGLIAGGAATAQAAAPATVSAAAPVAYTTGVSAGAVAPADPVAPQAPAAPGSVSLDINGVDGKPSQSITVIIALTILSVAPALLLLTTCFTKILIVLGLTRNALGLQGTPPNQVLAGLALFLTMFVMAPTFGAINDTAVQPYLKGEKTATVAFTDGSQPLKEFMLKQTRPEELALMTKAAKRDLPATREETPLTTLVPAFALSELRSAFIIGFVIFIPFLVIDIVVSGALMSLGMMMLPPVTVSLPFKLLLFVMIDGWGLIIKALVSSYTG